VRPEQVDLRDSTGGVVGGLRVVDLVAARCVVAVFDVTLVVVTVVVLTIVAIVVVTAEQTSRVRAATKGTADNGKIAGTGCTGRTGRSTSPTAGSGAGLGDLWCTWRPGSTRTGHYRLRGCADDFLHRVDHLRRGSTRQQNHRGCRAGGHESQAAVPPGCA